MPGIFSVHWPLCALFSQENVLVGAVGSEGVKVGSDESHFNVS